MVGATTIEPAGPDETAEQAADAISRALAFLERESDAIGLLDVSDLIGRARAKADARGGRAASGGTPSRLEAARANADRNRGHELRAANKSGLVGLDVVQLYEAQRHGLLTDFESRREAENVDVGDAASGLDIPFDE